MPLMSRTYLFSILLSFLHSVWISSGYEGVDIKMMKKATGG